MRRCIVYAAQSKCHQCNAAVLVVFVHVSDGILMVMHKELRVKICSGVKYVYFNTIK